MFSLRGSNVMTVYPAPPASARSDLPQRIAVQSVSGDLGTGRTVWRIYPMAGGRSLLEMSSRIDMRNANWISRQLSAGGTSINRSINIALGFVQLLGTKREAERRSGHTAPDLDGPLPPLRRPNLDMIHLAPMLIRGDLVLLTMRGDTIVQAAVAGRIGLDPHRTRAVMTDPSKFGSALVPGSTANVVGHDGSATLFDWSIPLPLIGVAGRMRIAQTGSVISVDGVRGSLASGKWRFDTFDYPWGEAAVIGWGRFDPADTTWLVRAVIHQTPYFREGLVAASEVMVVRSIRWRAWRDHPSTP